MTKHAQSTGADRHATMTPAEWRLHLVARGWHIFPLIPGTKRPAVSDWENRATTNPDAAVSWPSDAHGVGLACGPSGLLVIDCDNHGGAVPEALRGRGVTTGEDALALAWPEDGTSPWAECPSVLTPSGGVHLYYRDPTGGKLRNSAGRLAWQVDTRASGGYVVAPGTDLGAAGTYRPIHWPQRVPTAPDWLAASLQGPKAVQGPGAERRRPRAPRRPKGSFQVSPPLPGTFVTRALSRIAAARPGERNDTLNKQAFSLAKNGLLTQGVAEQLHHVARHCGLDDLEIRRTIMSAAKSQGAAE